MKQLNYISLFSSAGVGCYGFNQENFTVSIEHQDHDMYYDAKSTSASLKYSF